MSLPFVQGRFEDLPALPRLPHAFARTEGIDVPLDSKPFGRMKVHVRKFGAGPPLLLVHGLMTSNYSFRYVYEPLGAKYTCYAPDLPGAGRSDTPLSSPYSPQNLATWLHELMSALNLVGCDCVANSMGGYIAMTLAMKAPKAFARLVNVHSPGVPEPRLWALRTAFALPGSAWLYHRLVSRDVRRWAHSNVHYFDESLKSLEEADEYGGPLRRHEGREALRKYLTETMAIGPMKDFHRALARTPEFPIPLLLLYARRDPMVPPRFGEVFAKKIPNAKLVWLDEASHFAHVDAVERFLPPVFDFLGA